MSGVIEEFERIRKLHDKEGLAVSMRKGKVLGDALVSYPVWSKSSSRSTRSLEGEPPVPAWRTRMVLPPFLPRKTMYSVELVS